MRHGHATRSASSGRLAGGRLRSLAAALAALLVPLAWAAPAAAVPQFARTYGVSCNACHTVAPMLNQRGLAFAAAGFRGPEALESRRRDTLPLSIWITGRHEQQRSRDFDDSYLPKVELISAGVLGEHLSYFVEWRAVSLETRGDGTRRDRSGRFEDAYLNWQIDERLALRVGQFRALNQVDVSRRLSISEPALFSASLPGEPDANPRVASLRGFAPAGRSPGFALEYQSIAGESPADGLFHYLNVPFVGELSVPLTVEARREASFELRGPPKGAYLETVYRHGFKSVGAHAFVGDGRGLLTAVGTLDIENLHLTAGLGVGWHRDDEARLRSSFQAEYLLIRTDADALRPALGFRVEHVAPHEPAFIPYLALAGPNSFFTFLLQVQYRAQPGSHAVIFDLSVLF